MKKRMVCIECPKGCLLSVDIEGCAVKDVKGAKCPKGVGYAVTEVESPVRILTATVVAKGLEIKLVPVRTDRPMPKKDLARAMAEIGKLRLAKPVKAGETVVEDFLGLGVKLVATRTVDKRAANV